MLWKRGRNSDGDPERLHTMTPIDGTDVNDLIPSNQDMGTHSALVNPIGTDAQQIARDEQLTKKDRCDAEEQRRTRDPENLAA